MDKITDYATLQSAVAGMLHRPDDTDITGSIPLWVQMCEADLNDRLLLTGMESDEALTLVLNQNYIALPAGYISPIAFWLIVSSVRVPLQPLLPEQLEYSQTASQPRYWAIDAGNIRFDCPASSALSARLRCLKTSNLSASNTTNALLLRRPDVYLFGTLMQAALFTDEEDLAKWAGLYEKSIKGLKAAENRNRSIVELTTDLPMRRGANNILIGE